MQISVFCDINSDEMINIDFTHGKTVKQIYSNIMNKIFMDLCYGGIWLSEIISRSFMETEVILNLDNYFCKQWFYREELGLSGDWATKYIIISIVFKEFMKQHHMVVCDLTTHIPFMKKCKFSTSIHTRKLGDPATASQFQSAFKLTHWPLGNLNEILDM